MAVESNYIISPEWFQLPSTATNLLNTFLLGTKWISLEKKLAK